MATTIFNTANATTGNAKNGALVVNTGGVASSIIATSRSPEAVTTPTILSLDTFDERLDDPRYYTGDLVT